MQKPLKRILFFANLLLLSSPLAYAEYRAFLLKISSPKPATSAPLESAAVAPPSAEVPPAPQTSDFKLVKSNLDLDQYPAYYPLAPGETITELETWMCRGRTSDFQEICENPNKPRTPASQEPTPPPK